MSEKTAKYAILGDIHANLEALEAVLADAQAQGCNQYACLGDVVGYNANPRECIEIVRRLGMPCVKGNHDEYCSNQEPLEGLNPRAVMAMEWTRRGLDETEKQWLRELRLTSLVGGFAIVHATLDGPQRWGYTMDRLAAASSMTYQNTAVCFYGHTHLPMAFVRDSVVRGISLSRLQIESGRKYLINVGSVGEPRDGNPLAAYATYDLATGIVELRRVPFDWDHTEEKVRAVGLLPRRRTPLAAAWTGA